MNKKKKKKFCVYLTFSLMINCINIFLLINLIERVKKKPFLSLR